MTVTCTDTREEGMYPLPVLCHTILTGQSLVTGPVMGSYGAHICEGGEDNVLGGMAGKEQKSHCQVQLHV